MRPGGASKFFELVVVAAISLFGFNSGAALATVVGVLIEVSVVKVVNSTRGRCEAGMPQGNGRRNNWYFFIGVFFAVVVSGGLWQKSSPTTAQFWGRDE